MFNSFINISIDDIKAIYIGININGEKSIFLKYADDIVLYAEKRKMAYKFYLMFHRYGVMLIALELFETSLFIKQ